MNSRGLLLKRKNHWLAKIQIELYNELLDYMQANELTQNDIAAKLGVSKGYISRLMNGAFDHKLSKLIDLAFLMEKVPIINYPQLKNYMAREDEGIRLPYKIFEYYSMQSPANRGITPRFKVDLTRSFKKDAMTKIESNEYEINYV